jgi:ABC-type sugar transport system ATPase subunit
VLLLMDEPFSSLDADLRIQVRKAGARHFKVHQRHGCFVTMTRKRRCLWATAWRSFKWHD